MGRWKPDARGRLAQAAMELYSEHGFEQTTAAAIAERAGLTERTFFRHYADKREVLFAGADALQDALLSAVEEAADSLVALDAAAAGIEAIGALLPDRAVAQRRQAIIAANPELQERELMKMASLSDTLASALRGRGLTEPSAGLTAEIAIAVFKNAFERWVEETNQPELQELIQEAFAAVKALGAEAQPASR
jgi:AcrR family transcriptional regulator